MSITFRSGRFSLSAISSLLCNCTTTRGFIQAGHAGPFSFTGDNIGSLFGTDFLPGIFSGAQVTSHLGSGNASFTASGAAGNPDQLVTASAYLDFPVTTMQEPASFSLSSLIPNFAITTAVANQAYPEAAFTAAGSGAFASNPAPGATPAPSTLVLIGRGKPVSPALPTPRL
jgi:hypothetical protein